MYVNIFRSRKKTDLDVAAYAADAQRMERLAQKQKGFVDYRRYAAADGETLSLSVWQTEEDARAWARNVEHRAIQARGRADYYESYVVYSCCNATVRKFAQAAENAPGIDSQ